MKKSNKVNINKTKRFLNFCKLHTTWIMLPLYLVGCIICIYILILWERVPTSQHIVVANYILQQNAGNHYNANVHLTIDMSDACIHGETDEYGNLLCDNVHISFSDATNDRLHIKSKYNDEKSLVANDKYNVLLNRINQSHLALKKPIYSDVINFFHVMNKTSINNSLSTWQIQPLHRKEYKGLQATRVQPIKEGISGLIDEGFITHFTSDLMKDCSRHPVDGLILDSTSTHLYSRIVFFEKGKDFNLTTKQPSMSFTSLMTKVIEPYDISKQVIYIGYLAEGIDTFQIKLNFNEFVIISSYKEHGEIISSSSITHISTAKERYNRSGTEHLYNRTETDNNRENIEYSASMKDLQENALCLNVEKKEGCMLQWIRVSLLILLFGYFFTHVFICIIKISGLNRWFYKRKY